MKIRPIQDNNKRAAKTTLDGVEFCGLADIKLSELMNTDHKSK